MRTEPPEPLLLAGGPGLLGIKSLQHRRIPGMIHAPWGRVVGKWGEGGEETVNVPTLQGTPLPPPAGELPPPGALHDSRASPPLPPQA